MTERFLEAYAREHHEFQVIVQHIVEGIAVPLDRGHELAEFMWEIPTEHLNAVRRWVKHYGYAMDHIGQGATTKIKIFFY